ncbi:MAG: hypothetical protein CTY19_00425 [Methylomonas sp.]|nr:MAG: hypothetical protein CTY19_00425 [Methylomonas sp.]
MQLIVIKRLQVFQQSTQLIYQWIVIQRSHELLQLTAAKMRRTLIFMIQLTEKIHPFNCFRYSALVLFSDWCRYSSLKKLIVAREIWPKGLFLSRFSIFGQTLSGGKGRLRLIRQEHSNPRTTHA